MAPGSQSSPNRRLRQTNLSEFVREVRDKISDGAQRLRGEEEPAVFSLSPLSPAQAQKRDRSGAVTGAEAPTQDGAAALDDDGATLEEDDETSNASDSDQPPRRKQKSEASQLTELEANIENLQAGPNGNEEQIATMPVKITRGPDLSAAGETRNIDGSLGAISRMRGIQVLESNLRSESRHNSTTDPHSLSWDASHDLGNDIYDEYGMNEEDFRAMDNEETLRQEVLTSVPSVQSPTLVNTPEADPAPGAEAVLAELENKLENMGITINNTWGQLRSEYGSLQTYARVTRQAAGEAERSALEAHQRVTQVEAAMGSLQNAVSDQIAQQRGHLDHQATEVRIIQENYLSLERRMEEARQQLEARIIAIENGQQAADQRAADQRAADIPRDAAAHPADVGGDGGQMQSLDGLSVSVLKELVRKYKDDESRYWRSSIMVSGIRQPGPHHDAHTQARSQLRAVGLVPLFDLCDRWYITRNGNVRLTFKDPSEASKQLQEAKRALSSRRERGVHVETMVAPEEVSKKNTLLRLGRRLKTDGQCNSFEVVTRRGKTLLRTFSRQNGVALYDLDTESDELTQETSELCAICLDNLSGSILTVHGCGHRFHKKCGVTNFVLNGLSCPVCRQLPSTLSEESVTCLRCLTWEEPFNEPFDPRYLRISTCGHVHKGACLKDFFQQHSHDLDTMSPDDLEAFNSQHLSPCYTCATSGLRPQWIAAVAEISRAGPPEQRLRLVNSQPVAPRARPDPENIPAPSALMEPTPHHERGRQLDLGISVTDGLQQHEAQMRTQARYEGAANRRDQDAPASRPPAPGPPAPASNERGRRVRDREREDNLDRERSLRRRLEREAGYSTRLPPRNPRSDSRARRTVGDTRPPPGSRVRGGSPRPRPRPQTQGQQQPDDITDDPRAIYGRIVRHDYLTEEDMYVEPY